MQEQAPISDHAVSVCCRTFPDVHEVFQLKIAERLLSKHHISAADTGNPMRSSSNTANGLIMTIVWHDQRLLQFRSSVSLRHARPGHAHELDANRLSLFCFFCWTWASPYLDSVLSPLDLQIKDVYRQHSNLVFHQQLVKLAEIAQHQPY